jgi:hypothetical protein
MKIRYFPDTDTLYIELADRVSRSSEAVSDDLIVGQLVVVSTRIAMLRLRRFCW